MFHSRKQRGIFFGMWLIGILPEQSVLHGHSHDPLHTCTIETPKGMDSSQKNWIPLGTGIQFYYSMKDGTGSLAPSSTNYRPPIIVGTRRLDTFCINFTNPPNKNELNTNGWQAMHPRARPQWMIMSTAELWDRQLATNHITFAKLPGTKTKSYCTSLHGDENKKEPKKTPPDDSGNWVSWWRQYFFYEKTPITINLKKYKQTHIFVF